jgi:hypothetical protein
VVVEQPKACDFHQFLTDGHFSYGTIANDQYQFHMYSSLLCFLPGHRQ